MRPGRKPSAASKAYAGMNDEAWINQEFQTQGVREKLKSNLLYILTLSDSWTSWIIEHPDYLPDVEQGEFKPVLTDLRLDALLKSLLVYVNWKTDFSTREKNKVVGMIIHIYTKDWREVNAGVLQSIENFFVGKVV